MREIEKKETRRCERSFRHILILTRPHDVLADNGPDGAHQDKDKHDDDTERHGGGHALDAWALEHVGQGDGGKGETRVGEDHGEPVEVETLRRGSDDSNNRNAEEPETQGPKEDGRTDSEEQHDASVNNSMGITDDLEIIRQRLSHTNQSEGSKGRWANTDEHARPVFGGRQADLHQSSDVVGVHHETDRETKSLEGNASYDDRDTITGRLAASDNRRDGTTKHDREGRQNPRRHHGVQLVFMGGKDKRVLTDGGDHGTATVDPEEDLETLGKFLVRVITEALVQSSDHGCNGKPEGREEETFTVMTERLPHILMQDESDGHERSDDDEECKVETVDYPGNVLQALEVMRLVDNKEGQPAAAHGQGVPGPGKMA